MSNTSATGGYLNPSSSSGFPGGLTLNQFLQTVLVGVSGLSGDLVRPKWQIQPPKQPDISTNWMAFAVVRSSPEFSSYVNLNADENGYSLRQETLEIQCGFYGPDAESIAALVRDGFQITQNLEALRLANMGYASIDDALHVPDLVNERWVNRVEQTLYLRRQIQRVYPILSIVSADGTIHTVLGNEEYLLDWETPTLEEDG